MVSYNTWGISWGGSWGGSWGLSGGGVSSARKKYPRLIVIEDQRFAVDSEDQENTLLESYRDWLDSQQVKEPTKQKRRTIKIKALGSDNAESYVVGSIKPIPLANVPRIDFDAVAADSKAYFMMLERLQIQKHDEELLIMLACIA